MEIKEITFPTALVEIKDISNDNIDVFIELEDGTKYMVVIITPQNLLKLMEDNNKSYIEAGPPMIIVKELSYETIWAAINSFCDREAYWLKEYYLSGEFKISLLNEMIYKLNKD